MNPQLTVFYVEQQTNRTRLDQKAYQGWLAQEAAAHRENQDTSSNGVRELGCRCCGWLARQFLGGTAEQVLTSDQVTAPYQ